MTERLFTNVGNCKQLKRLKFVWYWRMCPVTIIAYPCKCFVSPVSWPQGSFFPVIEFQDYVRLFGFYAWFKFAWDRLFVDLLLNWCSEMGFHRHNNALAGLIVSKTQLPKHKSYFNWIYIFPRRRYGSSFTMCWGVWNACEYVKVSGTKILANLTDFEICRPAHAVYFASYEATKKCLGGNRPGHHPLLFATAGSVATIISDGIMTPIDVVKQRLQARFSIFFGTQVVPLLSSHLLWNTASPPNFWMIFLVCSQGWNLWVKTH